MCSSNKARERAERRQLHRQTKVLGQSTRSSASQSKDVPFMRDMPKHESTAPVGRPEYSVEPVHPPQPPPPYAAATSKSAFSFDPADVDRMPIDSKSTHEKHDLFVSTQGSSRPPLARTCSIPSTVIFTPSSTRPASTASDEALEDDDVQTHYSAPSHPSPGFKVQAHVPPYSASQVGRDPAVYEPAGGVPLHSRDEDQEAFDPFREPRRQQHPLFTAGEALLGAAGGILGGMRDRREKRHAALAMKWHRRRCADSDCWCRKEGGLYRGSGLPMLGF